MTNAVLLSVICQWINSLGYKAIQAPSDNPAPAGRYISVSLGGIRQVGDAFIPGPADELETKDASVMSVAQVQLYEVEGDGEWLRSIRNRLQLDDFDDFVKNHTESTETRDNGMAVWDIGEIVDNSSQDGAYWIRQRTMTFDVQFLDYVEFGGDGRTSGKRMVSVDGKLNNEQFNVEVTTNG